MAYLPSNICTKNYWNRTTTVKIIIGSWVVFFETQCTSTTTIVLWLSDEPVPEETFAHSHLSWLSIILYLLPPSTAIHGILHIQVTREIRFGVYVCVCVRPCMRVCGHW